MDLLLNNGWGSGWATKWNSELFDRVNGLLAPSRPAAAKPAVDVVEDGESYHFYFDLPGVEADSIEVKIEDRMLTLAAERTRPQYPKDAELHRDERYYGKFERNFELPERCAQEPISAVYRDGVLHVTIAKTAAAKPVRIKVSH